VYEENIQVLPTFQIVFIIRWDTKLQVPNYWLPKQHNIFES